MNKEQNIRKRLWNYIDGTCRAEDRLVCLLMQLIATNQEWKTKYQELLELQEPVEPSLGTG